MIIKITLLGYFILTRAITMIILMVDDEVQSILEDNRLKEETDLAIKILLLFELAVIPTLIIALMELVLKLHDWIKKYIEIFVDYIFSKFGRSD